jgi:protocatechuate 3,4-dioxygenase beta subunit
MSTIRVSPIVIVFALSILALAGCAGATTSAPAATATSQTLAEPSATALVAVQPEPAATEAATLEPTEEATPEQTANPAPAEPTATPASSAATAAPVQELSLGQSLAAAFTTPPTAAGEVILVTGQVLDTNGAPLPGAAVEFWQTDASGIYDHPGDGGTDGRDRGFQFYGTSIADAEGRYVFRTVQPGYYEPRPRHIHVKVKLDGRELLTTQFYFPEDQASLGGEGVFSQAGGLGDLLILPTMDTVDMYGTAVPLLAADLIIDTGSGGTLTATPAQAEGPYYPVVAVDQFDNDLAAAP